MKEWSGKRGSNSRPQPWQGCALPTELFPHLEPRRRDCREQRLEVKERPPADPRSLHAAPARPRAGTRSSTTSVSSAAAISSQRHAERVGLNPKGPSGTASSTGRRSAGSSCTCRSPRRRLCARCADLRHPFAQRRDRDLAADDHDRGERQQHARRSSRAGEHRRHSLLTSSTSATATISLSATGSRNAPRREVWPSRRAR